MARQDSKHKVWEWMRASGCTFRILVACSIVQGCTTTIPVRRDEPTDNDRVFNFEQVNSRLERTTGVIACRDGSTYEGIDVHVGPDSITFADKNSPNRFSFSSSDVVSITVKDNFGGILSGAVAGAVTGLGIAVGRFVLFRGGGSDEGVGALGFAIEVTAFGTVAGAITGGFVGNKHRFMFPVEEHSRTDTTTASRP